VDPGSAKRETRSPREVRRRVAAVARLSIAANVEPPGITPVRLGAAHGVQPWDDSALPAEPQADPADALGARSARARSRLALHTIPP